MKRVIVAFFLCLPLAGCGLGETAVSAAAGSASEIEQAKEGLKTEARVKQQIDAAVQLQRQNLQATEVSAQ